MSARQAAAFAPYGPDAFAIRAPRDGLRVLAEAARAREEVLEVQEGFDELVVRVRVGAAVAVVRRELSALSLALPARRASPGPREHRIEVRYDGADLDAVAQASGLSVDGVIALHTGIRYEVLAVGFQPGFAYLGFLPEKLRLPRRPAPRPRVPAGSVAIAADQTAVYPHDSPGGWHLLGRTDFACFSERGARLTPFSVGDWVYFVAANPKS